MNEERETLKDKKEDDDSPMALAYWTARCPSPPPAPGMLKKRMKRNEEVSTRSRNGRRIEVQGTKDSHDDLSLEDGSLLESLVNGHSSAEDRSSVGKREASGDRSEVLNRSTKPNNFDQLEMRRVEMETERANTHSSPRDGPLLEGSIDGESRVLGLSTGGLRKGRGRRRRDEGRKVSARDQPRDGNDSTTRLTSNPFPHSSQ